MKLRIYHQKQTKKRLISIDEDDLNQLLPFFNKWLPAHPPAISKTQELSEDIFTLAETFFNNQELYRIWQIAQDVVEKDFERKGYVLYGHVPIQRFADLTGKLYDFYVFHREKGPDSHDRRREYLLDMRSTVIAIIRYLSFHKDDE